MDSIITMRDAGKRYIKYDDIPLLLTSALRFRAVNKRGHLWAVRHVDLDVASGESLGVIGRNGSGKSTMFQMLAGVTGPTEGRVRVRGRVAPLISVGIGFHPELTGRENVYVNGTILGMTKREIDKRFDDIVAFSEIGDFIDTPVKFYSSGMFVRLGFSVAVASDPEVLLVDEVLAVGDVSFQMRCYDRMEEIRRGGATILVVSHNLNAVRRLCSRVMLLHNGEVRFVGDTDDGIAAYHDLLGAIAVETHGENAPDVGITHFDLEDASGRATTHVQAGDRIRFRAGARFSHDASPVFGLRIHKDTGQMVYSDTSWASFQNQVRAGSTVDCDIEFAADLPTGTYIAYLNVRTELSADSPHAIAQSITFFVSGRPFVRGLADLGGAFDVRPAEHSGNGTKARARRGVARDRVKGRLSPKR